MNQALYAHMNNKRKMKKKKKRMDIKTRRTELSVSEEETTHGCGKLTL
jgi:hypothetical protein